MDTEKKLKSLLQDIDKAQQNGDSAKTALMRIQDLAKSYEGYTSGAQDEEFFVVMHSESRDLMSDFNLQGRVFSDLANDIQKLQAFVEQKKQENDGNLRIEDVEDVNQQIARIDVKVGKARKQREDLEGHAFGNKNRLGFEHDVEMKLNRRKQESEELDRIIHDINADNQNMRDKIQSEIDSC